LNIIPSDGHVHQHLTSLDIYLNRPPLQILQCRTLQDVACGIYPCFYINYGDHLKVASSAAALIIDSGRLDLNPDFSPPDYLSHSYDRQALRTLSKKLPPSLKAVMRWLSLRLLHKDPASEERWYPSWETADRRIRRLRAFEQVTAAGHATTFYPDFSLQDAELFLTRSSDLLKQFVRSVETAFPDHEHIIQMGGKDSQLLSLIPKLCPERWHIFSAEPNTPLVRQWLDLNKISYGRFWSHDNSNEENARDLADKVLCSDLVSDPKQNKWLPKMREIAGSFDNRCIFWAGTAADAIYSYHTSFHARSREEYFSLHQTRVSSLQGNYHQTFKNFVGCPLLSPYHSAEIWHDLYRHYSPRLISPSTDYRNRLGELLCGRAVLWLDKNPGPAAYEYSDHLDTKALYLKAIQAHLGQT
jgi:hypothetical protein